MKTPQEVITAHQQRSDPHDNHCICGFGDEPSELGLSWAEHLWMKLREEAGIPVTGPEVGEIKAVAMRDAAASLDPLTKTYGLGIGEDGEDITVGSMLREYADNYERPGISEIKAVIRDLLAVGYALHDAKLPERLWGHGLRVVPETDR